MQRGRPPDPVWNGFRKEYTSSGPRAVCLGCGESFAGLASRLKKHAEHCGKLRDLIDHGQLQDPVLFLEELSGKAPPLVHLLGCLSVCLSQGLTSCLYPNEFFQ